MSETRGWSSKAVAIHGKAVGRRTAMNGERGVVLAVVSSQGAVDRIRRRGAVSKIALVLVLLSAVPISLVGAGVSDAGQCHDIRSDSNRLSTTLPAAPGVIASGPLKGGYTSTLGDYYGGSLVSNTYSYTVQLTIVTDRGTLSADGAGVETGLADIFIRPPFAEMYTVTGGDGRFAGATGRLFMTGNPATLDGGLPGAEGAVIGQVCVP